MVLPPLARQLDDWVDPADAFVALFGPDSAVAPGVDAVWLDSGPGATSGRSILGTGSRVLTASAARRRVVVDGVPTPGGVLDALRREVTSSRAARTPGSPLGWTGWIGYESGAVALGVPTRAGDGADSALLLLDRAAVFDHATGRVELIADDLPEGSDWLEAAARALSASAGAADAHLAEHPAPPARAAWRHTEDEYLDMIRACRDAICAGDAYQLCLTNLATARTAADPLAVHLRLRTASPAHHAGFLRIGGETLVSSSPEQFLRVTSDGRVRTKPIKGTRPRGTTPAADVALRAELEASEKERAENVMIVDLMRNDLGRVCEVGTVEVSRLLAVESYAQVHQLVSTVEGRLRSGMTAVDAVAACFPAGSMTGAPKLSAMTILAGLERGPRGVYAGCFGMFGADGSADLAMVIRSLRFRDGGVEIGAGGGITALSVPSEEVEEVRVKASALLRAAGLSASAL
ncbi:aminodeoxychorismate synthase component I [Leifsonia sp. ZF2019]|uniref:aminodeoxychorismate synthase component I n=1 Tax=Leifsonia sp. ZF2019 TaxID=2781978 RepID=UPI001CBAA299|nr:aminodeoxychorismate synthase component I [Leifsonia sp. ZF2019]UAJ81330.1 aminodeoxychorismate synthase component I [Leifsonia sp. ZF2019]